MRGDLAGAFLPSHSFEQYSDAEQKRACGFPRAAQRGFRSRRNAASSQSVCHSLAMEFVIESDENESQCP